MIELPATDGSFTERLVPTPHTVSDQLPYFGPEMPPSAISGLKGDKAESIVVLSKYIHFHQLIICFGDSAVIFRTTNLFTGKTILSSQMQTKTESKLLVQHHMCLFHTD